METHPKSERKNCLFFKQFVLGVTFTIGLSTTLSVEARMPAGGNASSTQTIKLDSLNPLKKVRTRTPGSYVPADEITPLPFKKKVILNQILVEDDAGVLSSMRSDFNKWEKTEEYAKNWNLKSTGLYETPDINQRKNYINKKMLKYVNKRLSGEVKNAEEGSTLHKVGQAQKALKPNAEAKVSEKVKLKFKARILQGEAKMNVENPWVKTNTVVNAKGNVQVNMHRDIKALKIESHVQYEVDQGVWVASLDRPLTETIRARVSSSQSDKDMAFSDESNRTVELLYSTPI